MPSATNYPGGFARFGGMPVLGTGPIPTTGDVFFVDATDDRASAGPEAGSRSAPSSTVQSAIDQCTASNGDYVFVLPGHTETIDGDINLNVAGVTVMGLGVAMTRPTFDFLAAGDTINISTAGCRLSNVILSLDSSAITVTAGITVGAVGVTVDNCRVMPHATSQFTDIITIGDFDDVTIANNSIYSLSTGAGTTGSGILINGTAERCQIVHNIVSGDFGTAALETSSAALDMVIAYNIFRNTNVAEVLECQDSTTGILSNNAFATGASAITAAQAFDTANLRCTENFMVNEVDESGGPIPTTATT